MTSPPQHLLQPWRFALRALSLAIPPSHRAAWLAEWHAELWFAAHAAAHSGDSPVAQHRSVARFCHGALADAHCLRRLDHPEPPTPHAAPLPATLLSRAAHRSPTLAASTGSGSPTRCLATLAALALAVFVVALALPSVRVLLTGPHRHTSARIVSLSPSGPADSLAPPLRLATVRAWQHRPQHLFSRFAFVTPVRKAVHIDSRHAPELTVALASRDLLRLLDPPLLLGQLPSTASHVPGQGTTTPEPAVYLSETTWRTRFAGRPDVLGTTLRVGLTPARIAGVLPDRTAPFGALSGSFASLDQSLDLWLVLPDALAARLPDSTRVFALAQLAPTAAETNPAVFEDRWHFSIPNALADDPGFDCVSLAAGGPHPWRLFLFTLFLAVITLPALTPLASLTQGDVPSITHIPPIAALRRHLFLAAKLTLLLPVAYLGALDLAAVIPAAAQGTQLLLSFPTLLLAIHWALRDQRLRCPTCLRTLTCPARVGQPSRNFLSWNGTELICTGGHGLLHVPELPTSWFSRPRWLHLDPSWQSLFLPA